MKKIDNELGRVLALSACVIAAFLAGCGDKPQGGAIEPARAAAEQKSLPAQPQVAPADAAVDLKADALERLYRNDPVARDAQMQKCDEAQESTMYLIERGKMEEADARMRSMVDMIACNVARSVTIDDWREKNRRANSR